MNQSCANKTYFDTLQCGWFTYILHNAAFMCLLIKITRAFRKSALQTYNYKYILMTRDH